MAYKISTSCIACGSCICECPVEAISAGDIYVINPEKCIDCGACVAGCPTDAIETQNQMETSNSKLGGCIISSLFSFGLLLGFAKIVEAADKYLKQ